MRRSVPMRALRAAAAVRGLRLSAGPHRPAGGRPGAAGERRRAHDGRRVGPVELEPEGAVGVDRVHVDARDGPRALTVVHGEGEVVAGACGGPAGGRVVVAEGVGERADADAEQVLEVVAAAGHLAVEDLVGTPAEVDVVARVRPEGEALAQQLAEPVDVEQRLVGVVVPVAGAADGAAADVDDRGPPAGCQQRGGVLEGRHVRVVEGQQHRPRAGPAVEVAVEVDRGEPALLEQLELAGEAGDRHEQVVGIVERGPGVDRVVHEHQRPLRVSEHGARPGSCCGNRRPGGPCPSPSTCRRRRR